MSAKSELINKLKSNKKTRQSYVRAKLNVNLPSQIRALRLKREMKQGDLAQEAEMMQPRISAMERPGATKFNIETLIRLAAAFKVGLMVKFVPFSEMLKWENEFNQDTFNVVKIDEDVEFQKEEQGRETATLKIEPDAGKTATLANFWNDIREKRLSEVLAPLDAVGDQFATTPLCLSLSEALAPLSGQESIIPKTAIGEGAGLSAAISTATGAGRSEDDMWSFWFYTPDGKRVEVTPRDKPSRRDTWLKKLKHRSKHQRKHRSSYAIRSSAPSMPIISNSSGASLT